jgi:Ca2+-binding EF-hand superfamily protein
LRKKLEYAFKLYDADSNGYLDTYEIRAVLTGMLDLLGADRKNHNVGQLADECIKDLDASRDGKVSMGECVFGGKKIPCYLMNNVFYYFPHLIFSFFR